MKTRLTVILAVLVTLAALTGCCCHKQQCPLKQETSAAAATK